jgi:hypothetical protein
VPYTVSSDGTYAFADPQGNLLEAFEVPGFVLVVESAKSGPTHNTPALITAIESVPTSITNLAGQNFNYMQWRTSSGGLEIGNVSIASSGDHTRLLPPLWDAESARRLFWWRHVSRYQH